MGVEIDTKVIDEKTNDLCRQFVRDVSHGEIREILATFLRMNFGKRRLV